MNIRIHDIGNYALRNYLLETPHGWIAIDTGYAGGLERYLKRFSALAPIDAIRYVFLTHSHNDHAGFLGELLEKTGAKLICNANSLPLLAAGENATPPGSGFSSHAALLFSLVKKTHSFPAFSPDDSAILLPNASRQVFHEMGLPIRILFLPGHTADSIALLLEETGELFCGDAAMNAVISTARHTIWIDDPAEFGKSWDRMLAVHPTRIYPSHGNPFPPEDLVRYRHFLDGRKLYLPK